MDPRLVAAVAENAAWCDAVCRANGVATEWCPATWRSVGRPPANYPDAVTLHSGMEPAVVADLVGGGPASVKDSFADLDLSPWGYAVLFEAAWISHGGLDAGDLGDWAEVRSTADMAIWAQAHGSVGVHGPGLLQHPDVRFLVAHEGEVVVAGAAVHRHRSVLGVSNVFSPLRPVGPTWSGLLGTLAVTDPGRPIVGYEHGGDLAVALGCGFVTVGPLRVWQRS